jgi:hypothetical protein
MRRLLLGAAAGAAGTLALDATTYADMALRGRPSSSTPERTVEKIAASRGIEIPGEGDQRQNRLTGLGALSGMMTGVSVGVGYGLLDVLHLRPRGLAGALLAGGGAMALANATMVRYDVTRPSQWGQEGWLSDIVPHVLYGVVLASTYALAAVDPPESDRRPARK